MAFACQREVSEVSKEHGCNVATCRKEICQESSALALPSDALLPQCQGCLQSLHFQGSPEVASGLLFSMSIFERTEIVMHELFGLQSTEVLG